MRHKIWLEYLNNLSQSILTYRSPRMQRRLVRNHFNGSVYNFFYNSVYNSVYNSGYRNQPQYTLHLWNQRYLDRMFSVLYLCTQRQQFYQSWILWRLLWRPHVHLYNLDCMWSGFRRCFKQWLWQLCNCERMSTWLSMVLRLRCHDWQRIYDRIELSSMRLRR